MLKIVTNFDGFSISKEGTDEPNRWLEIKMIENNWKISDWKWLEINSVCLTSAIRRMLSTGLILNGVFMDEWSGITTKIGIECLIPERSSSNCGRDFSIRWPTSFSTSIRMARSNLSERKQRITKSLWSVVRVGASSAFSLSMGSGCVSGRSLSYQSLHGPGLDAMWVQMLSKGPLRLDTARISSQDSCAIQLGWRSVGSKSESEGTGEDSFPGDNAEQ